MFRLFSVRINENLKVGYFDPNLKKGYVLLSRIDKMRPFDKQSLKVDKRALFI